MIKSHGFDSWLGRYQVLITWMVTVCGQGNQLGM